MPLVELSAGQIAFVDGIQLGPHGQGLVTRLEAMGMFPNKPVRILRKGILGGPLHIRVGSTTEVAIRREEARMVTVKLERGEV